MIIGKNLETLFSAVRDGINRLVNGKQVVGYQAIALSTSVVSTLTVPAGATEAWIQVEGATPSATVTSARYTLNGTTPVTGVTGTTAEAGMPLYNAAGQPVVIKGGSNLAGFQAIMATGAGQILKVTYWK
jgi:hypothetical protein